MTLGQGCMVSAWSCPCLILIG